MYIFNYLLPVLNEITLSIFHCFLLIFPHSSSQSSIPALTLSWRIFCWWSTGFHLEGIGDISEQQIFIHSNECDPDPKLRSYITKIMKPTGWKLWQCLNNVNIITIISHLCLLLKNICRFLLIMIDFYGLKLNRFFRFQKW